MTLGPLLRKIVERLTEAHDGMPFRVWLTEQTQGNKHFFYEASRDKALDSETGDFPITNEIEVVDEHFSETLAIETQRYDRVFIPIYGTRFGQKSNSEFLKPVRALVGALEIPESVEPRTVAETADLCGALIWNHRASRFLNMENQLGEILRKGKKSLLNWSLIGPEIIKATNSSNFAVVMRRAGELKNRLDLDKTILGPDHYLALISTNEQILEAGRWLRSIVPTRAAGDGKILFWMIVPLRTSHYRHTEPELELTDKVQHYVIFETDITENTSGRFIYSSVDRRLVEHSLTRFLEGIAEFRIDEVARKIGKLLPSALPSNPVPDLQNLLRETSSTVYDVVDACIVTPSLALSSNSGGAPKSVQPLVFSGKPFEISADILQKLLRHDEDVESHLDAKHAEVVVVGDRSGLVFSVGSSLLRRYVIFLFREPYSSYVSTEICARLAARLQLFLQSCDLRNDRTASLTQIAHVLRGPVSSALEEIEGIIRDRSRGNFHEIKFVGAKSEDDKLGLVVNWLSRSRSITDSAKHLLGELGPQSFQRRKVDLINAVSEVRFALEIERKQRRLTINTSDKINRSRNESVYIWGDEDLLWLMIYNLVENAIKYARRESVVTLSLSSIGTDKIRFAVENLGNLIWDFDKERIFAPYQRALNNLPMNGREGTGIGLPAANQIARAFNPENERGIVLSQSDVRTDRNVLGSIEFSVELQRAG